MLYLKRSRLKSLLDGWVDGWVDGWMEGKAGLRIAYSNQQTKKLKNISLLPRFDPRFTQGQNNSFATFVATPLCFLKYYLDLSNILSNLIADNFFAHNLIKCKNTS
jgi:hypothetical protein